MSFILFITDSNLFGSDTCRLGPSPLLSFSPAFFLGPFEHFFLYNIIFLIFPDKFISIQNEFIDSFYVVKVVFGKVSFMFDKGFKPRFQLINNFNRLLFLTFALNWKVVDVDLILTLWSSIIFCQRVLLTLRFVLIFSLLIDIFRFLLLLLIDGWFKVKVLLLWLQIDDLDI